MAGEFIISSETPEIAGILPYLIFLLIKMSLKLKISPRSLPSHHTAQNQPSQRTGTGLWHIFVPAAGCPDMRELLSARVANTQTCGHPRMGRDVTTHLAKLHRANSLVPKHLLAANLHFCRCRFSQLALG